MMQSTAELVRIEPQPDMMPFRVHFANRGDEWWYNERRHFRQTGNPQHGMLKSWKCPFGVNGKPVCVDGIFYWQRTEPQ